MKAAKVHLNASELRPERSLREKLFFSFAEGFVQQFLKQSNWLLFFSLALSPENRAAWVTPLTERAFPLDGHSLSTAAQALGALHLGKSVVLITTGAFLRESYPAFIERHLLDPSLNFKWIAFVEPSDPLGLSSLRGGVFPLVRVQQESSLQTGLHLIFSEHGPGFLEIPVPTENRAMFS